MHPDRGKQPPTLPSEDQFANQFDAWLDAYVAGPSTPAPEASSSASTDPTLDAAESAAHQVHELARSADLAETTVAPSTTAAPSWEDLLMTHVTPTAPVPAPIPFPSVHPRRMRSTQLESINRIVSIAAVVALLIAGASTAWIARDRITGGDGPATLQFAASPTSWPMSADAWLQPISGSECVPVPTSTDHDATQPRSYVVAHTPATDGDAIARQSRALTACEPKGPPGQHTNIETQFETSRAQQEAASSWIPSPEQIAVAQQFSARYATDGYQVVQHAPDDVDVFNSPSASSISFDDRTFVYITIFRPDESMALSDGRVAIPTTYLVSDNASWDFAQQQPYQWTTLTIWAKVGDTWLIDERLPLCIGDCDEYWQRVAVPLQSSGMATPAGDVHDQAFWMSQPSGCNVPTTAGTSPAQSTREYLPWAQAETTVGEQVALADRNLLACRQGNDNIPMSGLFTHRYQLPPTAGSAVDIDMLALMQDVSAAIPVQDPAAWIQQGQAAGGRGATSRLAVLPENVYQLPDGRYAAIPVTITEGNSADGTGTLTANGYLAFPISIYVRSGDIWQLDEQVSVCLGDCQSYWDSFHIIDPPAMPATPGTTTATPVVAIDQRRFTTSTF
ncbi:MAG: hypothetical protein QM589_13145 [Thermomicrobiales bacterium]